MLSNDEGDSHGLASLRTPKTVSQSPRNRLFDSLTLEVPAVGGLRPLRSTAGLKHRQPDTLNLGFPGRKRVAVDVVAKDGSFVVVGL